MTDKINYMTKYIRLEDVYKIIESNKINLLDSKGQMTLSISPNCIEQINSLTYIEPQVMIEMMIEKLRNKEFMYDLDMIKIDALEELLQKFKS